MSRVKGGVHAIKRRRTLLRRTKGYRFDRSKKEKTAIIAFLHAGAEAFAHRRKKKNDFRRLWTVRINAGLRVHGISYSKFIGAMSKKSIIIDRKILSELAQKEPDVFKKIVTEVTA